MKNKKIIIPVVILVIVAIVLIIVTIYKVTNKEQNGNAIDSDIENTIQTEEKVEEIKNETGATADTNIYQVEKEYDGREVLEIKPSVQVQTVWAGIVKQAMPTIEEINEAWEKAPNKSGVWISENSRSRFQEILNNVGVTEFTIDEQGYLTTKTKNINKDYEKLYEKLSDGKTYIIDISGTCYVRDDMTGEVVEYPFEQMDPEQIYEPYSSENYVIIEVTTNKAKKLTDSEILESIMNI